MWSPGASQKVLAALYVVLGQTQRYLGEYQGGN
jgi:hypothetical protein